jgi:hypothetical protein
MNALLTCLDEEEEKVRSNCFLSLVFDECTILVFDEILTLQYLIYYLFFARTMTLNQLSLIKTVKWRSKLVKWRICSLF